jgi:hypothetical protein
MFYRIPKRWTTIAWVLCLSVAVSADTGPRTGTRHPYQAVPQAAQPYTYNRVHKIGNIGFSITNYGFFGSELRGINDPCTRRPAPSFEFPIGSGIEYLFQGAMWVGAVKYRDTLVSVGADGWQIINEMFPREYPEGDILERTTRAILRADPNSACSDVLYSPEAVSEQDFVAVYSDTITNAQFVSADPFDGPHIPLGIEITQKSYSWSFDYAKDFVLMDFELRNIEPDPLTSLYMGIYMDHDVMHQGTSEGAQDDITGFLPTVPSSAGPEYLDTVNVAWIADNDGDPRSGRFYFGSPVGVSGVRVVRSPRPGLKFSFNWWIGNTTPARDWGPNRADHKVPYPVGNLGTPESNEAKYAVLSNGEFDYPQVEAALHHEVDGWLPPVSNAALAADLADGFDTRYLLSFGPFDVAPGEVLPLTIAIVAGEDFHNDPTAFSYFDAANPQPYLDQLDYSSFARNAQWAGWVYDTPGYDTDTNGYAGNYRIVGKDTIYYTGDGVPDFQGPPPPPAPDVRFTTSQNRIIMRWNGVLSETARDVFSNLSDFEGYRVYMSRTGLLADFALLTQRDNINFIRLKYNAGANRWQVKDPPFTLDSLQTLYNDLVDSSYGFTPFHPDSFKVADVDEALQEVLLDPIDPSRLDTSYYYFEAYDANEMADDVGLAYLADSLVHDVKQVVRKRFPHATPADTMIENGVPYNMYYDYEYVIDGLQLAEPAFIAVTTFDFGNPAAGLSSLESSPLSTMKEVWPINSSEVVNTDRPPVTVYPNPYRLADDYNATGWEDPKRQGMDPERARKVTFANVPETCTVSIWTLDGDLVRSLDHAEDPLSSQATVVVWDLITRNTQAVKTGLYIFTVESRYGTDVGKLVIVK